ncbi:hypothetical protein NHG25_07465 [Aerococcaceae bacterium NML191292]|nr:hypothetical protein [Aerococcaceae bacterium NML191292]MCW6661556.1 hypothetical protein [Aerococcaceae bacterium NML201209]
MTTDITGELLELRINNAVWLILESEFGITQANWAEQFTNNETIASMKLIVAVLRANGHHYSLEDIAENTDQVEVLNFVIAYQKALFGEQSDESKANEEVGK